VRINDDMPAKGIDRKKSREAASRKSAEGGGIASLFSTSLRRQELEIADYQQELQELKREIDQAGEELDQDPTMGRFKTFRTLITQLSRKVLTGAYKLELQSGPNSPSCHEVIKVIDRAADELYRLIMSEQKDRLKITHKIMELKGLVVDFLH
jgi:uncharacterized protein